MEGYTAISMLKYIYHIMKIGNLLRKVKYLYNRYLCSSVKIGVYGDSGTGKTQFLSTITGNGIYVEDRTRDLENYEFILTNGRRVKFIDTPGHKTAQTIRDELKIQILNNKISGIINIVNYGYQDGPGLNPDDVFHIDMRTVKDSYLRDNRKREILRTSEFIDIITSKIKVNWIITLVNKADIWYENREEVLNYYEAGEYNEKISELKRVTKLLVYPFCSIITPFANRPMLLNCGEKEKQQMIDIFLKKLQELINNKEC